MKVAKNGKSQTDSYSFHSGECLIMNYTELLKIPRQKCVYYEKECFFHTQLMNDNLYKIPLRLVKR
jgi:hypothetical protein